MNKVEYKALQWLKSQGYKDIKYQHSKTPDFIADGQHFEVKRLYTGTIIFFPSQIPSLSNDDTILVFDDQSSKPVAVIPFSKIDFNMGKWNNIKLHIAPEYGSVKITSDHLRDLKLLGLAWGKTSIDDVLERLIMPHRIDQIKALGIEVKNERSPTT